jgi:hypothetical protein
MPPELPQPDVDPIKLHTAAPRPVAVQWSTGQKTPQGNFFAVIFRGCRKQRRVCDLPAPGGGCDFPLPVPGYPPRARRARPGPRPAAARPRPAPRCPAGCGGRAVDSFARATGNRGRGGRRTRWRGCGARRRNRAGVAMVLPRNAIGPRNVRELMAAHERFMTTEQPVCGQLLLGRCHPCRSPFQVCHLTQLIWPGSPFCFRRQVPPQSPDLTFLDSPRLPLPPWFRPEHRAGRTRTILRHRQADRGVRRALGASPRKICGRFHGR